MRAPLVFCMVLLAGCAANQRAQAPSRSDPPQDVEPLLTQGIEALGRYDTRIAIEQYFDRAIALCRQRYGGTAKTYAARSPQEALYYLGQAARDNRQAIAIPSACADAYYLKGYASLDMGEIETAQANIERAVDLSPVNAQYLGELGHLYQSQRDWPRSLEIFERAERSADAFSPAEIRSAELARAKRGIGFSLIELGRLDEAEAKFRECLAIDGADEKALNELRYIEHLREAKGSGARSAR